MDLLIETVIETAGELVSEGIDRVTANKKEKDNTKNQEENQNGN